MAEPPKNDEKMNMEELRNKCLKPKSLFGDATDIGVVVTTKSVLKDDNKEDNKDNDNKDNSNPVPPSNLTDDIESDLDDECEQEAAIIKDESGQYVIQEDYKVNKQDYADWTCNKIIKKSNLVQLRKDQSKAFDKNTAFWKFLENKYPQFYPIFTEESVKKVKQLQKTEKTLISNMSCDEIFALYLYTTEFIYRDLNASLRQRQDEFAPFCGPLLSGLSKLPYACEFVKVYRGIKLRQGTEFEQRVHNLYKKDVIIRWDSFVSSSTNFDKAKKFAHPNGAVFEIINGFRGKNIAIFSAKPEEKEILFSISSHFKIIQQYKKKNDEILYVKCQEYPFPWDMKTILWVDDNPKENKYLIEMIENQGVMVIQRISTAGALEFFDFMSGGAVNLNTFNKFRVITDMHRYEYENDDCENKEQKARTEDKDAGITLIKELRKRGYTNPVCIFTTRPDIVGNKCKAAKIKIVEQKKEDIKVNVIITSDQFELMQWAQFA